MEILVITVWLAVVVGYGEGAFWWIRSHLFGLLIYMHPGYFWMSPVAQIALFTLPGIFLAMIAWRTKDWDVATFSVTIMSCAGWFNLLLLVPGLHTEARILAAAGLAAVTGRFFLRRRSACLRLFRRTIFWLLASIMALPFVYQLDEAERETSCMASLPASPRDGPNFLFLVLDTVRADALERYGRDASIAPNLTQLAEKGVVFEQALSNAPWTLPSMASIFTGRLPHEFSADWMSPLEDEHPTIAEALSARGWLTGGFVGNTRYCSRETGLARGFAHYEGYRLTLVDFALSTGLGRMVLIGELPIRFGWLDWPGRKRATEINGGFLQWLDRNEDRPFFAFLNYWDAHDPYIAPESFRNHWPANDLEEKLMRYWWWISKDPVTDQHIAMLKGAYEDCIRALDHEIGKLLNQLNHRGLLDNTIIIVTADHGEHFGEHDLLLHGNSLYEPLLHVPLIVACPGKVPSGIRVREPVALNGLANTLLEMLGADENFPGTSWVRHWSDGNRQETPPEILVSELASQAGFPPCHGRSPICRHGSMRCLREGHLKYIRAADLEEELYDLAKDSTEENNLINDPRYARDLERMRSHFRRMVVDF